MATTLKNIVQFTGLVVGVPVTTAHNLNVDGVNVQPDFYLASVGGFTIAVTTTSVTVTRTANATVDAVNVYVEYWHTENRVFGPFGPSQPATLTGSPFTSAPGVSGGGGFDPDRTIVVAKTGGDANTIAGGLTLVNALVPPPTAATPALVWVFPGTYQENPLTVPTGVLIWGQGATTTVVEAVVQTSPVFTLQVGAEVDGLTVSGANGVGGVGILANQAGTALVRAVQISNCTIGIRASGANVVVFAALVLIRRSAGAGAAVAAQADAGGKLELIAPHIEGAAGFLFGSGMYATGATSLVHGYAADISMCTNGALVENDGRAECYGGVIHDCTNGVRIGATSGVMRLFGVDQSNNTTYDLFIESAAGEFRSAGSAIRSDKMSLVAGASLLSTQISDFTGDNANMVLGELAVGLPNYPSEAVIGEGDSHVRQMTVLRNTNLEAGVWSDITAEMASASGSTAAAFPGTGIGNTLYIGGLEKLFPGVKVRTTIAIVLGAGSLVWEYWNGAAWTAFNLMTADSTAPYVSYAEDTFGRVNFEQVRFNTADFVGWATRALNGITRYWVRCRIAGAITTVPTLEQIKLHTNRTEINEDGVVEFFGSAILTRQISWHQRLTDDLSGASPTNGALALTANITLTPIDNRFNNNALDGFGGIFTVPIGIDTSRPLTLRWGWIAKANGAAPNNVVEFESRVGQIEIGDAIDGSVGDVLATQTVTIGAADQNILRENYFEFDISTLVPGEKVAFSLYRDGTGGNLHDTFTNSIDIVDVELFGYFWR